MVGLSPSFGGGYDPFPSNRDCKPAHNGETRIILYYNKIMGNTVGSTSTNFCNFFLAKKTLTFLVFGVPMAIGGQAQLD